MKLSPLKMAVAAAALSSMGAMAATQGTVGLTSTGDVTVTVSKGNVVRISQLTDIYLGNLLDGHALTAASSDACVYASFGNYTVDMSSLNGSAYVPLVQGSCPDPTLGGDPTICDDLILDGTNDGSLAVNATFVMANGPDTVAYTARFNGDTYTGAGSLGPYAGNPTEPDCNTFGPNATVTAELAAGALTGATDGYYQDLLTIVVTPN